MIMYESMNLIDWKDKRCGFNCSEKPKNVNYVVWGKNGYFSLACEEHYFINREKTGWRSMEEGFFMKMWARIKFEIRKFFK